MKLGRMFLKLLVAALGIFCAFMLTACIRSRGNIGDVIDRAEARSCSSCKSDDTGLEYTLNDGGESYSLSFVGKAEKNVVVLAEVDGKPVTKIASGTFSYYYTGCSSGYIGLNLETLTLPATITEIEEGAFIDEARDSYAHGRLGKLFYQGTLEQWMNISFGSSPFSGGTQLYIGGEPVEEITVPESVTQIGANTFFGLGSLKKINFHGGVTKICETAFRNCDGLKALDIPDSVTELGEDVFYDCDGLEEVRLGEGVTRVPSRAFAGCPHIYSITIKGVLSELGFSAFNNCKSLLELDLSNSVLTEIPRYAFYNCYNLTSFVVPESVKNIGDYAFGGCEKLLEIYNLSSLNIVCGSDGHGQIAKNALIVHTSLDVESSIIQNGDFAFFKSDKNYLLKYTGEGGEIALPENFEGENYYIRDKAFANNNRISAVNIPATVTGVGKEAFYRCSALKSVVFDDGAESIGAEAFSQCGSLQSAVLPSTLKTLGYEAFYYCNLLESVDLGGAAEVGGKAFYMCGKLTNVTFTGGIKSIGEEAFGRCGSLQNVALPEELEAIGQCAFAYSGLKSVHIASTVTEIGNECFRSCLLDSVTVATGNLTYKSLGNCLIDIVNKTLIKACVNSEIPTDGSFTAIGDYAFESTNIASVVVPEGITSIGESAFAYSGLVSVNLPSTLECSGDGAFAYCLKLESVEMKEGLTFVSSYSFSGCSALTRVRLPKSLRKIGFYAFCGCDNLKTLNYAGTRNEWASVMDNSSSSWIDKTLWVQTSNGRILQKAN